MVRVEVIGRPLTIGRGPQYQVGERFGLDESLPTSAEILRRGWVRVISSSPVFSRSVDTPPIDKMIRRSSARKKRKRSRE